MGYVEQLIAELRAKALASSRRISRHTEHVCHRAADLIAAMAALDGKVNVGMVRNVFSRRLDLGRQQRAYSWHEIQDALAEIEQAAKALTTQAKVVSHASAGPEY